MRREHPMLFKDRLVRALLDGSKTQTRRPAKDAEGAFWDHSGYVPTPVSDDKRIWTFRHADGSEAGWAPTFECPHGGIGDLIWCRETWAPDDDLESYWGGIEDFPDDAKTWESMKFRATASSFELQTTKWRPSIHMPKWACRLWLEITDVRVERVASISEEDAAKEGIPFCEKCDKPHCGQWGRGAIDDELSNAAGGRPWRDCYGICKGRTYKEEFRDNWNQIYPGSWERNDWVWALSFKRTEAKK